MCLGMFLIQHGCTMKSRLRKLPRTLDARLQSKRCEMTRLKERGINEVVVVAVGVVIVSRVARGSAVEIVSVTVGVTRDQMLAHATCCPTLLLLLLRLLMPLLLATAGASGYCYSWPDWHSRDRYGRDILVILPSLQWKEEWPG